MSDPIDILELIVVVSHRFAYLLYMQEVVETALLGHFAQYRLLRVFPILYPTRKKPEESVIRIFADGILLGCWVKHDAAPAIATFLVLSFLPELRNYLCH